MSWSTLEPRIREIAEQVLTDRQLEMWKLELDGRGTRFIGLRLDLPRTTVRDRLTAIHRSLRRSGVRQREDRSYYLEEAA